MLPGLLLVGVVLLAVLGGGSSKAAPRRPSGGGGGTSGGGGELPPGDDGTEAAIDAAQEAVDAAVANAAKVGPGVRNLDTLQAWVGQFQAAAEGMAAVGYELTEDELAAGDRLLARFRDALNELQVIAAQGSASNEPDVLGALAQQAALYGSRGQGVAAELRAKREAIIAAIAAQYSGG